MSQASHSLSADSRGAQRETRLERYISQKPIRTAVAAAASLGYAGAGLAMASWPALLLLSAHNDELRGVVAVHAPAIKWVLQLWLPLAWACLCALGASAFIAVELGGVKVIRAMIWGGISLLSLALLLDVYLKLMGRF